MYSIAFPSQMCFNITFFKDLHQKKIFGVFIIIYEVSSFNLAFLFTVIPFLKCSFDQNVA